MKRKEVQDEIKKYDDVSPSLIPVDLDALHKLLQLLNDELRDDEVQRRLDKTKKRVGKNLRGAIEKLEEVGHSNLIIHIRKTIPHFEVPYLEYATPDPPPWVIRWLPLK